MDYGRRWTAVLVGHSYIRRLSHYIYVYGGQLPSQPDAVQRWHQRGRLLRTDGLYYKLPVAGVIFIHIGENDWASRADGHWPIYHESGDRHGMYSQCPLCHHQWASQIHSPLVQLMHPRQQMSATAGEGNHSASLSANWLTKFVPPHYLILNAIAKAGHVNKNVPS